MIIDDDKYIMDLVASFLRKDSIDSVSYSNIGDALRALMKEDFDCVLSDLHLPGMDGISLMPLVREIKPDMAIGIMTGDADPEVMARTLKDGADFFLQKPKDIMKIGEFIRNAVRKMPLGKEVGDVEDSSDGRL